MLLHRPTRDEEGFVVVMSVIVLFIGLLLAGAAVTQVSSTESSVRRDGTSKRALQAARAGVDAASWLTVATANTSWNSGSTACPSQSGTTVGYAAASQTVSGAATGTPSGWCAPVAIQLGANESVTYQLSLPYTHGSTTARDVIATGSVAKGSTSAVTRRVRQRIKATAGAAVSPFISAGVIGLNSITMSNSAMIGSPTSKINVLSGGDITMSNSAQVCGDATPGPGRAVVLTNSASVCGSKAPATVAPTLGDVVLPSADDNAQLDTLFSQPGGHCPTGNPMCQNSTWLDGDLLLKNNDDLTLTGNNWVMCRLTMANSSKLRFTPTPGQESTPIRVYFKAPTACGGETAPIELGNNIDIITTSTYPVQFYVVGSASTTTNVLLSNAVSPTFGVIYAPKSTVKLSNHVEIKGAIAAKVLELSNNTEIGTDPTFVFNANSLGAITAAGGAGPTTYAPETFVECASTASTDPSTGC